MTRFSLPSESESESGTEIESTNSLEPISQESSNVYWSAEERVGQAQRMADHNLSDEHMEGFPATGPSGQTIYPSSDPEGTTELYRILEETRAQTRNQSQEILSLQTTMAEMVSLLKRQTQAQVTIPTEPPAIIPQHTTNNTSVTQPPRASKVKPLEWPPVYNHSNSNEWITTHGILLYIYQRDVVDRKIMEPSDFFMELYSQAVTGAAKAMITGPFQIMMNSGKISDALGLLKVMDDTFRDRNANQNASALLYACKQFRDESLSSFLPRFEQLLSRSLKSTAEDEHKIHDLHNALNQTTRTHLIGHSLPNSFREFVEKLSVVGSQIDGVGLVKTRSYNFGQQGIFDDGTRGIAGG